MVSIEQVEDRPPGGAWIEQGVRHAGDFLLSRDGEEAAIEVRNDVEPVGTFLRGSVQCAKQWQEVFSVVVLAVRLPTVAQAVAGQPFLLLHEAKEKKPPDQALREATRRREMALGSGCCDRVDLVADFAVETRGNALGVEEFLQAEAGVSLQQSDGKLDADPRGRSGCGSQRKLPGTGESILRSQPNLEPGVGSLHDEQVRRGELLDLLLGGRSLAEPLPGCSGLGFASPRDAGGVGESRGPVWGVLRVLPSSE